MYEKISGEHTDSEELLNSQAPDGRTGAPQGPCPEPSLQATATNVAQFQGPSFELQIPGKQRLMEGEEAPAERS